MEIKKGYDVVFKSGETKDGKAVWLKVGAMLEKENGKYSIKLDAIPTGNWDGWLNIVERRPKEDSSSSAPF
jgi:hypothetical protein